MVTGQKLGTSELLFKCARQMGLRPSWVTPNGLFAIHVAGKEKYINFARSPLNSQTSASLTKDKYLTRLILARHAMPNIPFARPRSQAEAKAFLDKYDKIIAKPVSGAGAYDIHIIVQAAQLQSLKITDYILERYIAGKELRYLILNDMIIGVHRSEYGTSVEETRPLRRISYPSSAWDPALVSLSTQTAQILDLKFAAIDYLIDDNGRMYILEVNTMPGLKWFHSPTSGPAVDVARLFLEAMSEDQELEVTPAIKNPLGASPVMAYN